MKRVATLLIIGSLLAPVSCKKEAKPVVSETPIRNVLIITVDTLRADALSIYGSNLRSNFFEQLASKSVVFDRAYTTAPITLPAHTSLLTGLYPPAHGVRNNGTYRASPQLELLSEIAQKNGLSTAAFVGAFPLASQFGLNQGFQLYDDTFSVSPKDTTFIYAERNAETVRTNAESWLSKVSGKPFFLWMHLFDPHHPYLTHDPSSAAHPYLQEVQYVDQQLVLFFDFLRSRNLLANTAVVITSDHGEAFGEHGEVSHSIFLYNTTLHVPLLISIPGVQPQRRGEVARLVDVYPTILEIMKWPALKHVDGQSLMPLLRGQTLPPAESYAETLAPALDFGWSPLYSLQTRDSKFIDAPKPEFYNLQKDPKETRNLISPGSVEEYKARIRAIQNGQSPDSPAPALSKEDREKLESLGYVSSGNQRMTNSKIDPKDRIEVARKIAELTMSNLTPAQKAQSYREIARTEASNPLLLLRYAELLLQLDRYEEAALAFHQVIQLNYPSAAAYNGLATVYFHQKEMSKAQELLENAVSKKIADGETYHNLAEFYWTRGLQEKAFQCYDESIRFHFLPAYFQKARLLEVLGKTEEALHLLDQAGLRDPSSGEVHFHIGMIHFRHQRFAEAVQEFQQVLKREPDAKWILFNIGMAYNRMGDQQKSKEALEAFLRDAPADMKQERAQAELLLKR